MEIEGDGLSLSWEYLGKALKAAAEINEADISESHGGEGRNDTLC